MQGALKDAASVMCGKRWSRTTGSKVSLPAVVAQHQQLFLELCSQLIHLQHVHDV